MTLSTPSRIRLSKTLSHCLRHAPWEYEIVLDQQGWVEVEAILETLRGRRREWKELSLQDLLEMNDASERKRYEIDETRIRAAYGHSLKARIQIEETLPPEILYHGTTPEFLEIILNTGLKPMKRQYVHLAEDTRMAANIGSRRTQTPRVLKVEALRAYQQGHKFYKADSNIWLSDALPSIFLTLL